MRVQISLDLLNGDEGWILDEPILNESMQILYQAGKVLNQNTVTQLKRYFSKSDKKLNEIIIKVHYNLDMLTDRQKKIIQNIIEQNCDIANFIGADLYYSTFEALHNTYSNSKKSMENTFKVISDCITEIVKIIEANPEISYSLGKYKEPINNTIFDHSIRVAQFAVALANIYNHSINSIDNQLNLKSIGIAALLHDYGAWFNNDSEMKKLASIPVSNIILKTCPNISPNLFKQPYDEKYRTAYAFCALENFLDMPTLTTLLLSSESVDGSFGLNIKNSRNDSISVGARIVFICNLYDSLLQRVINKNGSLENVNLVLAQLAENGVIDRELTTLFNDHIPLYSVGVRVLLSNGEYATVVERFKGKDNYKPIVKTLTNPPFKPNIIDLRQTTNITIKEVVGSSELLADKINEITKAQLATINITSVPYRDNQNQQANKVL